MSSITDINWTSASLDRSTTSPQSEKDGFRSYINSLKTLDDEVIFNFISNNGNDEQESALSTILYPDDMRRCSSIKDEVFLANLYDERYSNCTHSNLVQIGKSKMLQISEEDIEEISRLTLFQRKSKLWVPLRRGRITGTNLKDCCGTNIEKPSITTISRVINASKHFDRRIPSVRYQLKNKKKPSENISLKQKKTMKTSNTKNVVSYLIRTCHISLIQQMDSYSAIVMVVDVLKLNVSKYWSPNRLMY